MRNPLETGRSWPRRTPSRDRAGTRKFAALAVFVATWLPQHARSAATADEIAACRSVTDPAERAYCYDRLFGAPEASASGSPEAAPARDAGALAADAADTAPAAAPAHSDLAIRWELDRGTNRGLWLPRGHERTYILPARWTSAVNEAPRSPTQAAPDPVRSSRPIEGKFQLSLKLKALDDVLGGTTDVWIGYTQQSHWQVYDRDESRPFRETNYSPEVFATVPLRIPVLGLTARMLNVGVVHQSNGQSDPRSRSWNRAYAQLGFERGPFVLLVKPWLRLSERDRVDNNPDILDYVGRGEVQALWSRGRHTVSLQVRNSFHDAWRGSAQLHWSFPLIGNLRGYVQVFDGYGESLIDYNHSQTTVGLGVLVVDVQ